MREIMLVCVALAIAVLVTMFKPAMTAGFLKSEQEKAEQAMEHEIEKAKKTIEENKGKE